MPLPLDFDALGVELSDEQKAALQSKIDESHDSEISGLKKKNSDLIGTQKGLKESLKQFENVDLEQVNKLMEQLESNEETRLISEGKIDDVVALRTERMSKSYEAKLNEATEKAQKAEEFSNKYRDRVLRGNIQEAAGEVGLEKSAVEDSYYRLRDFFTVNDEGEALAMKDDQIVMGKDGKTPLTIKEHLESLRDTAPHWFPKASGSGAQGSTGTGNAPSSWGECKTDEQKVEFIKAQSQQDS